MGARSSKSSSLLESSPAPVEPSSLAPLRNSTIFMSGESIKVAAYRLAEAQGRYTMDLGEKVEKGEGCTFVEWLVIHPRVPKLYAFSSFWKPFGKKLPLPKERTGELSVFDVDPSSGNKLLHRATLGTFGRQPCSATCSPNGSLLAVGHYLDGRATLWPLDGDGNPSAEGAVTWKLPWKAADVPDEKRVIDGQTGPLCHDVVFSPSGRWLATCDAGQGRIVLFPVGSKLEKSPTPIIKDVGTKARAPAGIQRMLIRRVGQRPRHLAFHPKAGIVYVLYEAANQISVHTFDDSSGAIGDALQEISCGAVYEPCCLCMSGVSAAAEIEVLPEGDTLIVSNRGIRSSSTLASYSIDRSSHLLTPASQIILSGNSPRHFIMHEGLLIVGLEKSGSLAVYTVDASRLAPVAVLPLPGPMQGSGPQCVRVFPPK